MIGLFLVFIKPKFKGYFVFFLWCAREAGPGFDMFESELIQFTLNFCQGTKIQKRL